MTAWPAIAAALLALSQTPAMDPAPAPPAPPAASIASNDLDRDGLDDSFEQALLERFRPTLMLSANECDSRPSEFEANRKDPVHPKRNGTLYGQVFRPAPGGPQIEIHYYHLWARDCGRGSHPLDIEQAAVLLEPAAGADPALAESYIARYWTAAGHEGTVCDAAMAARASALASETSGASVWVSHGKHASFLSQATCGRLGCGGDKCEVMSAMPRGKLINLGEPGAPLNGATWTASRKWSFQKKMTTAFPPSVIARVEAAGPREIVSVHPELVPAKAVIMSGNHTINAVGTGGKHTGSALGTADRKTSNALDTAATKVGSSLGKAHSKTLEFLGFKKRKPETEAAKQTGAALNSEPEETADVTKPAESPSKPQSAPKKD